MAFDIEQYRPMKPINVARGDAGQHAVSKRLSMAGWQVTRESEKNLAPNKGIIDFRTISKDGETRLVEIKTCKTYNFYTNIFGEKNLFDCLALDYKIVDRYDDYSKKFNRPLDLYWVNFYEGKIYRQELQTLLLKVSINNCIFPRTHFIGGVENLLFSVEQFEWYSNLDQEEIWQFRQLERKYSPKAVTGDEIFS